MYINRKRAEALIWKAWLIYRALVSTQKHFASERNERLFWAPIATQLLFNMLRFKEQGFIQFYIALFFGTAQQTSERSLFQLKHSLSRFSNCLNFQSHSIMENKTLRISHTSGKGKKGLIPVFFFFLLNRIIQTDSSILL